MEGIGSPESGKSPTMGQYNLLLGIVIGVVIVAVFGFITLLVSSFSESKAAFEDLKDQINQQSAKLEALYSTCYLARPK